MSGWRSWSFFGFVFVFGIFGWNWKVVDIIYSLVFYVVYFWDLIEKEFELLIMSNKVRIFLKVMK